MKIIELKKEEYKDYKLVFKYETDSHYKLDLNKENNGFSIELSLEKLGTIILKSFTDSLFEEHWEFPSAFGIFEDNKLFAILEVNREKWNKRLRVTNILVDEDKRNLGIGTLLMEKAKEVAVLENLRAIILETQSCNIKAIAFYLKQGFVLGGFDTTCYTNNDLDNREVRLEFVWINDSFIEKNL